MNDSRSGWIGAVLGVILVLSGGAWSQNMESFALPPCVWDAATDVVLHDRLLDAMIDAAAATGVLPDRQQEKFFIVLQHYLISSGNLLFVSRTVGEGLVLWRDDCEPDPNADTHVQAYVSGLTAQQQLALVTYRDLVATFECDLKSHDVSDSHKESWPVCRPVADLACAAGNGGV